MKSITISKKKKSCIENSTKVEIKLITFTRKIIRLFLHNIIFAAISNYLSLSLSLEEIFSRNILEPFKDSLDDIKSKCFETTLIPGYFSGPGDKGRGGRMEELPARFPRLPHFPTPLSPLLPHPFVLSAAPGPP